MRKRVQHTTQYELDVYKEIKRTQGRNSFSDRVNELLLDHLKIKRSEKSVERFEVTDILPPKLAKGYSPTWLTKIKKQPGGGNERTPG